MTGSVAAPTPEDRLDAERIVQARLTRSSDYRAAETAFAAKRTPRVQ